MDDNHDKNEQRGKRRIKFCIKLDYFLNLSTVHEKFCACLFISYE